MILIVGGAHQGKRACAGALLNIKKQEFEAQLADGKTCLPELFLQKKYICGYQEMIRRLMQDGVDTDAYTRRLITAEPEVVILDEVGYGIVPMDKFERDYREETGHAGQLLAEHAEQVYRVVCGIAQKIK